MQNAEKKKIIAEKAFKARNVIRWLHELVMQRRLFSQTKSEMKKSEASGSCSNDDDVIVDCLEQARQFLEDAGQSYKIVNVKSSFTR